MTENIQIGFIKLYYHTQPECDLGNTVVKEVMS